jgi:hypothetical protein
MDGIEKDNIMEYYNIVHLRQLCAVSVLKERFNINGIGAGTFFASS